MIPWKWWVVMALIFGAMLAKLWYPQGGDPVKSVFFGENQEIVAVFGGEPWDE